MYRRLSLLEASGILNVSPDPARGLFSALSIAEDRVSRLDERLAGSQLAASWMLRVRFQEALAWLWNEGELVALEDLVLHDARLDQRAPDPLVTRAYSALRRRRRASRTPEPDLQSWMGVQLMLGRRATANTSGASTAILAALAPRRTRALEWWEESEDKAPAPPLGFLGALAVPSDLPFDQDEDVYAFWAADRPELAGWPPLLCAAVRLDLWAQLSPLPRASDIGMLAIEAQLRRAGRVRAAPLLAEIGRRFLAQRNRRWSLHTTPIERIAFWLDVFAEGARLGLAEIDSLHIARQRLDRHLVGRRSSSHLPGLVDLLLKSPLVTASQAAQALKISQQAVRVMIEELGGTVKEVTGRRSFRAWRI